MQSITVQTPGDLKISLLQAANIADLMQKFYREPAHEAEYQKWLAAQDRSEAV